MLKVQVIDDPSACQLLVRLLAYIGSEGWVVVHIIKLH